MEYIKSDGELYAWSYKNNAPSKTFILFARTKDGGTRIAVHMDKNECEELKEALEEHLGINKNV